VKPSFSFPLPVRQSVPTHNGWVSRAWDYDAAIAAIKSGGWFSHLLSYDWNSTATTRAVFQFQRERYDV